MSINSITFKIMTTKIISWLFGIVFFAIGLVNLFWGDDSLFGAFKEKTGFTITNTVKIVLAIFILWATLGVGELFDKTDLMLNDFKS
ncbi:MAG: hypothetical protein US81_C0009G0019 [Parcubacteria group bacterium GW2011_GWE2_38_18]|nr:MAG: hypothetical protein US81_C0009G0019 [Parcubacteria group bacterium GW2011_GWE2_38_18]